MRNRPRRRSQAACGHGTKPAPNQTKHLVNLQGGATMPDKDTLRKAKRDKRQGKAREHTGRRIRPRGDSPHSRRQARREIDPTSDRDRAVQGTTRRRGPAAAREGRGIRKDTQERGAGLRARSRSAAGSQADGEAEAGHSPRTQARATCRGVPSGAREAGAFCSCPTDAGATLGGGAEGGAHQGRRGAIGRCPEGGARTGETRRYLSGAYG